MTCSIKSLCGASKALMILLISDRSRVMIDTQQAGQRVKETESMCMGHNNFSSTLDCCTMNDSAAKECGLPAQ
jgi:hypothetical protein